MILLIVFLLTRNMVKSNYYLKEHGYSVDIDINMKMFDVNDNKIYIKYVIVDTECEYELLIEMGDIL